MKPLIRRSYLTDPPRYYLLTRYRIEGDTVIASTKYDVTDQIAALLDAAPPAPGLDAEVAELQALFDLRYAADMRAIKMWQAAHPGNDLVWPDHADLVVWLLEQLDEQA